VASAASAADANYVFYLRLSEESIDPAITLGFVAGHVFVERCLRTQTKAGAQLQLGNDAVPLSRSPGSHATPGMIYDMYDMIYDI